MELSLTDAARLLGKTPRQVRYMLKLGQIQGKRGDNGRWRVASETLPLSDKDLKSRADKVGALRGAVEEALGPHLDARGKRGFSVRETAAFSVGAPLHRVMVSKLGEEHRACKALGEALVCVGCGVHRYHGPDKHAAYGEARERAATAAVLLYLSDEQVALAEQIERELLPAITGLVRRYERR